jgi:hypothetical protein
MIWPSVAIVSFLAADVIRATAFTLLSLVFTVLIFEGASRLRAKYWSPVPVSIAVSTSKVYVPQSKSMLWLDPVAFAIASKELRSLTRRREMTRFLAIPVMLVVASMIPVLSSGANTRSSFSETALFLLAEASIVLPIMLSSVSIGQEGKSILNIYMLPISADELIAGKLFLSWLISGIGIVGITILLQFLAPMPVLQLLLVLVAVLFNMLILGYIGLGAGSRYPDFTIGPRARFITFTGFIVAFIIAFLMTAGAFTPLIMYQTGSFETLNLGANGSALFTIVLTVIMGTILLALAHSYCLQGVKKLFSNMEA